MIHRTLFFSALLSLMFFSTTLFAFFDDNPLDEIRIYQLSYTGIDDLLSRLCREKKSFNTKIGDVARMFIDTPYSKDPLSDENVNWLPYQTTNCTMFVLTVAAFANSCGVSEAYMHMRHLHYKGAQIGFRQRYHFTSDRITDPENRYFTAETERWVRHPSSLKHVTLQLNRKKQGGYFFGDRLGTWTKEVSLDYVPRQGFTPEMLKKRVPGVIGIAFVDTSLWEKGIIIGHEGILINNDLYHASPGQGVNVIPDYLSGAFSKSKWDGFVLFRINQVNE